MKKFIPKEKLGKKARKQFDSEQRTTWLFSPVTKKVESKKRYNRKKKAHDRYDDYGMGFSYGGGYRNRRSRSILGLYDRVLLCYNVEKLADAEKRGASRKAVGWLFPPTRYSGLE